MDRRPDPYVSELLHLRASPQQNDGHDAPTRQPSSQFVPDAQQNYTPHGQPHSSQAYRSASPAPTGATLVAGSAMQLAGNYPAYSNTPLRPPAPVPYHPGITTIKRPSRRTLSDTIATVCAGQHWRIGHMCRRNVAAVYSILTRY